VPSVDTLAAAAVIERQQGIQAGRYVVVPRTLVFVRNGDEVLLLRRSHERAVWPGCLNGVGGHVEAGESLAQSALREVAEETGLAVRDLELAGLLHVTDSSAPCGVLVAVFTAFADERATVASAEGDPCWIELDQVLDRDVVPDLVHIVPRLWRSGTQRPFLATATADGEVAFTV